MEETKFKRAVIRVVDNGYEIYFEQYVGAFKESSKVAKDLQEVKTILRIKFMKKSKTWRLSIQNDRDIHAKGFTEALCEHEIGHHKGVHGCDGCCASWPKEISKQVTKD